MGPDVPDGAPQQHGVVLRDRGQRVRERQSRVRVLFADIALDGRAFFLDWETIVQDMVGSLRTQAGRDPSDRDVSALLGELTTRSDGFATRSARHDVRLHRTARKRLGNRVVGARELTGDALDLAGDGLTVIAYSAKPGSQAEDQLKLLAAWSATAHTHDTEPARIAPSGDEPG